MAFRRFSENLKTYLTVIVLLIVLVFSFLKNKQKNNFDPFTLKLNSSLGVSTLSDFNKNKTVLLYFGFLSCPDACPTTLSTMAAVFRELSQPQLDKLTFLFVDLDPDRDNLLKLKEYSAFFHPKIIPISLNASDLNLFTEYFGIAYMKVPLKSKMGYTIDHSTNIVMLSPDGKFLDPIEHGTPKNVILMRLKKLN
jgi:protein SCO1/2